METSGNTLTQTSKMRTQNTLNNERGEETPIDLKKNKRSSIERNISANQPGTPNSQNRLSINLLGLISPEKKPRSSFQDGFLSPRYRKSVIGDLFTTRSKKLILKPKLDYKKKWRNVITMLRVGLRLNKINEDIKMFGTSPNLFDLTTRDRSKVKNILYPFNDNKALNGRGDLPFPLIHPHSLVKRVWNPLIFVLLLYCLTIVPYILIYQPQAVPLSSLASVFGLLIDFLFLIDLGLNLLSSDFDEDNVSQKSFKVLFFKYLKSLNVCLNSLAFS